MYSFIVNPNSRSGEGRNVWNRLRSIMESQGISYQYFLTEYVGHATVLAQRISAAGTPEDPVTLVTVGGDGTIYEVLTGIIDLSSVVFGFIPVGSGNDFCRMFGDEMDLYRDAGALLDGFEHPIDIIHCNGRYSANICSVGIDARIGTSVHNYSKLPLIGGSAAYVVSAVIEMFRGISRHMRITSGDFVADAKHALVCACNGRFYGGGFNPSLTAMPDDGIMDIFVAKKLNILQCAALIGKYAKGRADELPQFVTHLRTDRITIEFDEDNVVNIDGEAIFTKKAELRLLPKAARLIVPAGMHFFDESLKTAGAMG